MKKTISIQDVIREQEKYTKNRKIKIKKQEVNLLDTLNEEQLSAVMSNKKNNLVVASAGTGKTSTIIGRVITLLKSGLNPDEIILLTFTSKAGKEMLDRLRKYFSDDIVEQIFAGTFHAYGLLLLAKMKIERKIKKPKEIKLFFESIMEKREHTEELTTFAYSSKTILEYIGLYENTNIGESFSEWLMDKFKARLKETENEDSIKRIEENIALYETYQAIYDDFSTSKKENKICDFNDLLKIALFYHQKNENTLKCIIVDEYQDTNNSQNKILKQLEKTGSSIFAVGDYDQSIYAFNGSNVYLIKDFEKNYGETGTVGIFSLCKNYRSSRKICEMANKCIENNERIIPKELIPMKRGDYANPTVLKSLTQTEQAEKIVEIILEGKYDFNDIAVLFRTNNSANLVEPILIQNNIPTIRAKSGSFFDGEDISVLIAVFRVILGKEKSIMEFLLLSYFIKGISKDECKILYGLKEKNRDTRKAFAEFYKTIKDNKTSTSIVDTSWKEFNELLNDCVNIEKVETIFKLIYNTQSYADMFDKYVNKALGFARGKELGEVKEQIEKKHELLLEIARSSDSIKIFLLKTTFSSKGEDEAYGVNLMTVHASKGLEFKQVFVIDLVEDKFPNHKLSNNGGGGIDEERRLFYVANTRAEEELYLSYYLQDDKQNPTVKSRFIGECQIE